MRFFPLLRFLLVFCVFFSAFALFSQPVLIGTSSGLYQLESGDQLKPLLPGVDVRKILHAGSHWYFLTSEGVLASRDLVNFEPRNTGLPVKTLKIYDGSQKSFIKEIQELKDLEFDPHNPLNMVTATKDYVFLSTDGGLSWRNEGSPINFPSIKAVAVSSQPRLQLFVSHTIRGPHVKTAGLSNANWQALAGDLAQSCPTLRADELSDIVIAKTAAGQQIWAANSFLPNVYRYLETSSQFEARYSGKADFAAYDSLMVRGDEVLFVTDGAVMRLGPDGTVSRADTETRFVQRVGGLLDTQLKTVWHPALSGRPLALSELWLVSFHDQKPYRQMAEARNGLYLRTGFVVEEDSRAEYDAFSRDRNLNMLTVDIKDDYGRLRYIPNDPLVKSISRTVNPLDLESFVADMKAQGRYLVARIVVFKDQHLYNYSGGRYAVWDNATGKPWQGYQNVRREVEVPQDPPAGSALRDSSSLLPEGDAAALADAARAGSAPRTQVVTERQYYEEFWVDPYSEIVWEYNIAIAREIIARGFDEVQFDYIRFPTDGVNLDKATYRWRDSGMDMESALMSFLRYAREHVEAPIGIDIYGANGWYRSGVRTGQDVELLSRYVDVILPMFYPSHFEQTFMAFEPAVLRPYRIYYLGTLRNHYMARKQVVVRPWVQAFFINVRYDREFYNPNYVNLQVDGVRYAVNQGMTFWNNSGRYDDIPVLLTLPDGRLTGPNTSPDTPRQP